MIERLTKGSALTHAEGDANLRELKSGNVTAWVRFDGSTIPPTIKDSFNVFDVSKRSDGFYIVELSNPLDNLNASVSCSAQANTMVGIDLSLPATLTTVPIAVYNSAGSPYNSSDISISIHGGMNNGIL